MDYKDIINQIKAKTPAPVILLHGEESYYIDLISDAASNYLLEDHEKDFNQTIVYGKDVNLAHLLEQVKQYPMMAERQLVIVKEAQEVKNWEMMERYFETPVPTTILILCHKHKKADSRKKFFKNIKKSGIVFESKKLYENQVEPWIQNHLKVLGFTISQKAAALLVDFLGTDLSKIAKELEKLSIILEKGTQISDVHIEENIGISKDYNPFELANAVAKKDIHKAHKIINYFEQNPKIAHPASLIPNLFNVFDRLMRAHFLKIRDPRQLQSTLGLNYFAAQDTVAGLRLYNPKKIARNITLLHTYDLKSKGFNRGSCSDADLMRELIYQLMH